LSGSPVEVKDMMARFSTDVIASCAFGINSNSLKDPDTEFWSYLRSVTDYSVQKGLAMLMAFFAPYLGSLFRLKFLEEKTEGYIKKTVWSTVEYRSETRTIYI
jgi:cytochrome P450 family 6